MKKYLLIVCIACLASCVDEFDNSNSTTTSDPNGIITNVVSNVTGMVVNKNGQGIANATVRLGELSTFTNDAGAYIFRNAEMNKHGMHITATDNSSGNPTGNEYFFGSTLVYPISDKTITSRITLMDRGEADEFLNGEGGTVALVDSDITNGNIVFEENSFVDSDGGIYDGTVLVYSRYLYPIDVRTKDFMPGALIGRSIDGMTGSLKSFSMMGVVIESPNGNPLFLAPNKTAQIEFPIAEELIPVAPESIPLWFFNEEKGRWEEEGTASKFINSVGAVSYKGEVSHFTFWNCDIFEESSFITGRVIDSDGIGMSNLEVRLTLEDQSISAYDYTDSEGYYKGNVPQGEIFIIEVLSHCEAAYSGSIGPFFNDVEFINDIGASFSSVDSLTTMVTGELVSCGGDPISLGKIQLLENGEFVSFYNADDDGFISFTIDQGCYNGELALFGYDRQNLMTTDTFYFGYQEHLHLGELSTCNDNYPNEFVYFKEFSGMRSLEEVSFDFQNFEITATDNDTDMSVSLNLDGYMGPENYEQDDPGSASLVQFADCSAESLVFNIGGFFIQEETEKFIIGEFSTNQWISVNDIPDGCMEPNGNNDFILCSFILNK